MGGGRARDGKKVGGERKKERYQKCQEALEPAGKGSEFQRPSGSKGSRWRNQCKTGPCRYGPSMGRGDAEFSAGAVTEEKRQ